MKDVFSVGLGLFVILALAEFFEPGFATNFINMPAYALGLVVLGVLTLRKT